MNSLTEYRPPRIVSLAALIQYLEEIEDDYEVLKEEVADLLPIVLKDERLKRGLSQQDIAQVTELSQPYFAHVEAGRKTMPLSTLRKVLKAMEQFNGRD